MVPEFSKCWQLFLPVLYHEGPCYGDVSSFWCWLIGSSVQLQPFCYCTTLALWSMQLIPSWPSSAPALLATYTCHPMCGKMKCKTVLEYVINTIADILQPVTTGFSPALNHKKLVPNIFISIYSQFKLGWHVNPY